MRLRAGRIEGDMNRFETINAERDELFDRWEALTATRDWLTSQYNDPNNLAFYHQDFVLAWRDGVDQYLLQVTTQALPQVCQAAPLTLPRL